MLFNSVYGKSSGGGGGRLPVGFQEVEYIQSSGTQYINTGFRFTQEIGEIKTKMMSLEMVSTYHQSRFAGAYNTNNTRSFLLYNNCTPVKVGIGADDWNTGFTMAIDTIYEIDVKTPVQGSCDYTLNGSTTNLTWTGSLVTGRDYYIFCGNENGSPSNYGKDRLYYFKIYEGGTIVRDLVPCYNKTTGVIGLFDLVNYTFYSNAGTGTFTKGPDVGGGWQPGANTIAYYSLNGNANDGSTNGWNGTWSGTENYAVGIGGNICANFTGSSYITTSCNTEPSTVAFFLRWNSLENPGRQDWRQVLGMSSGWENSWCFRAIPVTANSTTIQGDWFVFNSSTMNQYTNASLVDLNWHHVCITTDGTTTYLYFDGTLAGSYTGKLTCNGNFLMAGNTGNYIAFNGCLQHVILESTQWTQQDIQDYLSNFNY